VNLLRFLVILLLHPHAPAAVPAVTFLRAAATDRVGDRGRLVLNVPNALIAQNRDQSLNPIIV
jgi:hypothetical protein